MKSIEACKDLTGKRVLVRASLNVPIEGGKVQDAFRLKKALKTIEYVRSRGARVIVVSHLSGDKTASMSPIYEELKKHMALTYVSDVVGAEARSAALSLTEGTVLLLENLRRNAGEEAGDLAFAQTLASFADMYVMDDFSVLHRKHASVVLVPGILPTFVGYVVEEEVRRLQGALTPKTPSLAILGGAKFQTKEALIRKCLPLYDFVFVGGALANDVFNAQGYEVGKSLVSRHAELSDILSHPKLLVPIDVTVDGPLGRHVAKPDEIAPTESILDAGPATMDMLKPYIFRSKTILWNGPLGNYEHGFAEQTEVLARMASDSDAEVFVGGGDSVAAIGRTPIDEKQVFVSTGGGAMVEFLTEGTLPGLAVLGYQKV